MKYKDDGDIGKRAKIIFAEDSYEILRAISNGNWVSSVPKVLIDLIDDDYDTALKSVSIAPIIYFDLNKDFKNDKQIIKDTLKAFKKFGKSNEINIRIEPLGKRKEDLCEDEKLCKREQRKLY